MIDTVAAEELDQLRRKHKILIEENNELSIKVYRHFLFTFHNFLLILL